MSLQGLDSKRTDADLGARWGSYITYSIAQRISSKHASRPSSSDSSEFGDGGEVYKAIHSKHSMSTFNSYAGYNTDGTLHTPDDPVPPTPEWVNGRVEGSGVDSEGRFSDMRKTEPEVDHAKAAEEGRRSLDHGGVTQADDDRSIEEARRSEEAEEMQAGQTGRAV